MGGDENPQLIQLVFEKMAPNMMDLLAFWNDVDVEFEASQDAKTAIT